MKIKLSSLKSRVAKRLFLLFFSLILLPVIFISAGSYYKVESLIYDENIASLQRGSKEYGLDIYRRLTYAQNLLNKAIEMTDKNAVSDPVSLQFLDAYFDNYALYENDNLIFDKHTGVVEFVAFIDVMSRYNKKSGLVTVDYLNDKKLVYLVASNENLMLMGKLNLDYLWPNEELSAFEDLCILNVDGEIIYCSKNIASEAVSLIVNSNANLPVTWVDNNSVKMISATWSLFMRHSFSESDWKIVTSKPEGIISKSIQEFKISFIPAVVFIFLMVVLVSLYMVRRNLRPVEALIGGTKAISENNFEYQVFVDTKDEYEDLANSFNNMTRSLRFEFKYNKVLLKINKTILVDEKTSSCAKVILTELINFEDLEFSMLYIDNPHDPEDNRLFQYDHHADLFEQTKVKNIVELEKISNSASKEPVVFNASEIRKRMPFVSVKDQYVYHYYPLFQNDRNIAFIIIAVKHSELNFRMIDYLSHCVVAFNALQRGKLLNHHAYFDKLTGIHNRNYFEEKVKSILSLETRSAYALLFIDLDRFKNINDTLGHHVGDILLKNVSNHIAQSIPCDSIFSRFSGDEFVAFLSIDCDDAALVYADNIISSLGKSFKIENYSVTIGASIGVVIAYQGYGDFEYLLKCADLARYEAKKNGQNSYCLYSQSLQEELVNKNKIESFIKVAVENNYLTIHYQPKVDLKNKELTGFEALSRFTHPEDGNIPPDVVFSLAEDTGHIFSLGLEVMRIALVQLKEWIDKDLWKERRLAINISPMQIFSSNFVDQFEQLLTTIGVSPSYVELEITEGVFIENDSTIIDRIKYLQSIGVIISMDDFGTGYSSLSYITKLPFDTLKIDKSFISNLKRGNKDVGLIKSMIQIAHNLDFHVIAEGVETKAELEFLVDNDCDEIQGYIYSRPVPAADAEKLLIEPGIEYLFK